MSAITPVSTPLRKAIVAAVSTCLALAAALALAAPADAGPRTFRPGIVNGTIPSEGELGAIRGIGARSVRVVFSWDVIEVRRRTGSSCATALYNFDRHNELVSRAGQRGISILPVLGDSPKYAGKIGARYPAPGTRAFQDFQCFVRALVGHYGRGGAFPARDIIEWQVWNEPNLPIYNPGKNVSPRKYGQLVKATAGSIRSQDSRATIVLAGLPEETKGGMNSNVFLRKMYRVNGIRGKFDAVALHPYARDARGTKGALTRLRETLRDLGDRRRPVWVTEVGYGTDGPKGYFLVTTEKGQADKLQSTLQMLRQNRKRFKVGTFHWFDLRDQASYSENSRFWTHYAGLYRKNGTPKPSCGRYKAFTGIGGRCAPIQEGATSSSIAPDGGFTLGPEAAVDAGLVPSPPE